MSASVSSSNSAITVQQPNPSPRYKKAAWNMLISTVAIATFLLLATAAVSSITIAGFMFSIGVVPDGLYLLLSGIAIGALAFYVGRKAIKRCELTHNCIHHPEKLKAKGN